MDTVWAIFQVTLYGTFVIKIKPDNALNLKLIKWQPESGVVLFSTGWTVEFEPNQICTWTQNSIVSIKLAPVEGLNLN